MRPAFLRRLRPLPLGPHDQVIIRREWVEIRRHASSLDTASGWIPRAVLEALGVDCSPLDRGDTLWFSRQQSAAMRAHREWHEGAEPPGYPASGVVAQ